MIVDGNALCFSVGKVSTGEDSSPEVEEVEEDNCAKVFHVIAPRNWDRE